MGAPTKSEVTLLASTFQGNGGQPAVGTAVDVTGMHVIGLTGWIGRLSGTAHASPWATLLLEGNTSATDESMWEPIPDACYTMAAGASIANTTLNGAVSAAATTITVTSATNIAAGDLLFLSHGSLTANYEVVRVASVSGTTVTIDGSVINAHDNGATVTDQAERFCIPALNVTGLSRVRAKLINQSGQTVAARMHGIKTVL
jgi:hypothetical protein